MKLILMLGALFSACLLMALPGAASAQATRTWISGVGDDANPCSRTAPCKTFPGAISKTAAGGEIDCLDPGGFGTVTITKSITLDCASGAGGMAGSILASGVNGINVNVPTGTNPVVIIRNLSINGISPSGSGGLNGISFTGTTAGTVLIVDHVNIFNFINNGINIAPAANSKVTISDSNIQNTATLTGNAAILVRPTGSANVSVTVSHVTMSSQLNGIFADASGGAGIMHTNVTDSVITATGNSGIAISSTGAANSNTADVFNSLITYSINAGAAVAGSGGSLKLGGNSITNNVTGVAAVSGGTLLSFKNNMISDNGTDGTPITAVSGYSGGGQ